MLHQLNSDLETVTLNCAEALAKYVHFGQVDKQGKPYIEHVMRVAKACRNLSLDQRVAAILHDVLEDHPEKVRDGALISSLFGFEVYHLVQTLTREKELETYDEYIETLAREPLAIPIKLADLVDNLDPTRGPIPDSLQERLRERYEKAAAKLMAVYTQNTINRQAGLPDAADVGE